jgi:cation diffusion facilitator CzcD-associated flavoprotein CzcO
VEFSATPAGHDIEVMNPMISNQEPVVVVGAGTSGLASAAELGRAGIKTVVLEEAEQVGSSWRKRYDRLRLNSPRPFSKLPKGRYPRKTGIFPSRDEVVGYLEDYTHKKELDVRFGTRLERLDRNGHGWVLRTSSGDMNARQVIVASGHERRPFMPDWPGREDFRGRLIHSADYRNPEPFRNEDVLVVGPGCSGAEIAYDIMEGGARRVRLAVRTPPNILIRNPAGPLMARMMMKLPTKVADAVLGRVRRLELGDLSPYGLPVPEEGVFSRLERLGVAPMIVDKVVIEAIKEGRIEIVPAVEAVDEKGVLLAGGDRIQPDSVVAATGYRSGLEPMVGHLGVLNEGGAPRVAEHEVAPGLRFVGYVPFPGMIAYSAGEARRVAKSIARSGA